MPTTTGPSARKRNAIIGMPPLFVGWPPRAVLAEWSELAAASVRPARAGTSGAHATEGGAVPGASVSDDVLVCGPDPSGIDPVFSSCAFCWTDLSVVALIAGAPFGAGAVAGALLPAVALISGAGIGGLTARISTFGVGGMASPGLPDTEAPPAAGFGSDKAGLECISLDGSIVAGAAACCAGWPGARRYQHFL